MTLNDICVKPVALLTKSHMKCRPVCQQINCFIKCKCYKCHTMATFAGRYQSFLFEGAIKTPTIINGKFGGLLRELHGIQLFLKGPGHWLAFCRSKNFRPFWFSSSLLPSLEHNGKSFAHLLHKTTEDKKGQKLLQKYFCLCVHIVLAQLCRQENSVLGSGVPGNP